MPITWEMDNADRIKKFLADHPGRFYCNRCLSDEVPVVNSTQANEVTRLLRGVAPYRHGKMMCCRCRGDRQCIAYGQEPPLADSLEPVQHP